MTDAKVNLPDDLLSSKGADDPWAGKEDAPAGNDEEKLPIGFLDDSKDQVMSDNSIPLSPQWLYAKPSESKPGLSATPTPGDMRASNSLTHGNPPDPVQKDGWRLDGSQEKKEWRRNAPEIESGRRWREEERETGLLGRRDRRKEGDRENEYRKSDRRTDSSSIRETIETRPLPSSDRWHDVTSRSSGHETRRDSKWSSRWGPEDKEKDSRNEKRLDAEKEDAHSEKQSFLSNSRTSERETDSRDKWRPRHRQEGHSVGSTVYRAAPGFGLERGRLEGSNVGFAPGRGRSNIIGNLSLSRSSVTGPIGASPVERNELGHGKSALSADTFCYPRGKLLDIYRKQKLVPTFDNIPDGLEEVPPITVSGSLEPLAFVAPDAEEEAILKDIGKGKIITSGAIYNSSKDKTAKVIENETAVGDTVLTESRALKPPASDTEEVGESSAQTARDHTMCRNDAGLLDGNASKKNLLDENGLDIIKHETQVTATTVEMSSGGGMPLVSKGSITDVCSNHLSTEGTVCETVMVNGDGLMDNSMAITLPKIEDVESAATFEVHTNLPDDSNSLFDFSAIQDIPSNEQCGNDGAEVKQLERSTPPEELSLFYRDPQGEIQGPFLGVDIISWFEQGFFGTDLPVCLSDAPEGTPFQELGLVMPHLKCIERTASGMNHNALPEFTDTVEGNLNSCTPSSGFIVTTTDDQWKLPSSKGPLDHHVQLEKSKHEDMLDAHRSGLATSDLEVSAMIHNSERRSFHDLVAHENEDVLFPGQSESGSGNPLGKPAGSLYDSVVNPASHQQLANESVMRNHKSLIDVSNDSVHPLGLSWSELQGPHLNPSHLSSISSGVGDQGHPINTAIGRESHLLSHNQSLFAASADSPVVSETWSDSYRRNALANQNVIQGGPRHMTRVEQDPERYNLTEQLLSQQLQKQLIQQNLLSNNRPIHLNGSLLDQLQSPTVPHSLSHMHQQSVSPPLSDVELLLKLQLKQQQQFELQEQQRLHQQQLELQEQHRLQQQLHHRMQLQQQQQQSQAQQLLLEQLLHHQMQDPGFVQSHVDPLRSNNVLDEVLFRQHLQRELQQQSHPIRHRDPFEQLILSKFGQSLHPEHHNDLLELLHAKHGQMPALEQQFLSIQQEQMKARQLSAASRQLVLEDERQVGGVWSVDESGQFVRASAAAHQMQSPGVNSLDFFQRQQRPSSFEQPSNLERNLALQDRLHLGLYESNSLPFERPISLPPSASEMSMDLPNALARVHALEIQGRHSQMHSSGQVGSFSTSLHSHSPQIPNQFRSSHFDAMEGSWSEHHGLHPNDLIESRIHQFHLEAERKKPEPERNILFEDPNSWTIPNDGNANQVLMDVLHQKAGRPLNQSLELGEGAPASRYESREPSWLVSASPSDETYSILQSQVVLGDSFFKGSLGPNLEQTMPECANSLEDSERFPYRTNSGAFIEDERSFRGMNETAQAIYGDTNLSDKSSIDRLDITEVKEGKKGKRRGSKSKVVNKSVAEAQESGVVLEDSALEDCGDLSVKSSVKRPSLGGSGACYNYEIGVDNAYDDKMDKNWTSPVIKEFDDALLKRTPVSRVSSSHEVLSELAAIPTVKGKMPANSAGSEGTRDTVNSSIQASEAAASCKKDGRFRRTSSYGDADVSEPSFIDMLKSTKKPAPEPDGTVGFSEHDAAHGGKGSKKKGKKGRQIDPALLGFKVSSNRIMMGEIQRLDD